MLVFYQIEINPVTNPRTGRVDRPVDDRGPTSEEVPAAIAAVAALEDPTRRALYRYIVAAPKPVGREQAATALDLPHHVVRFHLDRLSAAGLLQIEYKRPAGRGGPGAGHPTKLYRPATANYAVSLPERRYDSAGAVLTRAVAAAMREGTPVDEALRLAAGETGHAIGAKAKPHGIRRRGRHGALPAALATLDSCGFVPRPDKDSYVLANCPFQMLAKVEPEVICRMNLAFVGALLDEIGVRSATPRLDPADGRCCVTLRLMQTG
jgi:predicted ArsR family transcriptional regulator